MGVKERGIEAADTEMSVEELRVQHLMAVKIRQMREARGLTQMELAAELGEPFTEEMVAEYEAGDLPMDALRVLAMLKALDIPWENIYPKQLLAECVVQSGYGELTEERRRSVDLLISALMEDQTKAPSRGNAAV